MPIPTTAYAHVRLTVTDIERSRAFYDAVLGLPVAFEVPADADEQTREQLGFLYGGVIYQLGDSLLGLRPVATDRFDEDRTGLDHLAFAVASRAVLQDAVTVLDDLGDPPGVGGHDGDAVGPGFQEDDPEGVGPRGHGEHVDRSVELGSLLQRQRPEDRHPGR